MSSIMLDTVTVAFVQPFILLCPDRPGSFCILENKCTRVPKSSCVLKHSSFYVRGTTAASALLAICSCIDSLLKRCWFSPCRVSAHVCVCACVRVEGEEERQRIFALKFMLHHFLSVSSSSLAVCFQDVTGYRHQGWSQGGFQPRWRSRRC